MIQKSYIENPITHKVVKNTGELPKYFVEGCYPAIVEPLMWSAAQERINDADRNRKANCAEYPFRGIMFCSVCGKAFNQSPTITTNRTLISVYRCLSRKDNSSQPVPGMTYVRPHTVRYTADPSPALIDYRERYSKKPEPRQYLCSDTRIKLDTPPKGFVRAWNQLVSKKQRYVATLQNGSSSESAYTRYYSAELISLLEEGLRLTDFDCGLFRKTVERIDVNPTGKLTYCFRAGIKITV